MSEAREASEAPPTLETVSSPVLPDAPSQAPGTPSDDREALAAEGTTGQGTPRPDARDAAAVPDGPSTAEDVRAGEDVR
ncbi:hypothetical protein NGM37_03560, partial [Streptomyces sp. TRM76130]|nr:hypothetical protein [Streptomyces sp. TRM76130]